MGERILHSECHRPVATAQCPPGDGNRAMNDREHEALPIGQLGVDSPLNGSSTPNCPIGSIPFLLSFRGRSREISPALDCVERVGDLSLRFEMTGEKVGCRSDNLTLTMHSR